MKQHPINKQQSPQLQQRRQRLQSQALLSVLAAFLSIGGGLLSGCSDQIVPGDPQQQELISNVVFTKSISSPPNAAFRPVVIDHDGGLIRELPEGRLLLAPPGGGAIISLNEEQDGAAIYRINDGTLLGEIPLPFGTKIDFTSAAIAPDGERIAFTVLTDGDGNGSYEVRQAYIANRDGSEGITLDVGAGHESYMRFSPDGSQIAFFRRDTSASEGSLYVANVDGTDVRKITDVAHVWHDNSMVFDWSPDSKAIVYADGRTSASPDIYIAQLDGSGVKMIGAGAFPSFSPDGSRIVCLSTDGLRILNSSGVGSPKELGIYGAFPDWSPDGSSILYSRFDPSIDLDQQTYGLERIDVASAEVTHLADNAYMGFWF